MKKLCLVLIASLCAHAFAQSPSEQAQLFLSQVNQDSTKALDQLIGNGLMSDSKYRDSTFALKSQIPGHLALSGALVKAKPEKIYEKNTSSVTTELVYLQAYEKSPLIWHFNFYRPKDKWELLSIFYNQGMPPEK